MKNKLLKLLAMMMVLALVLAFAGCGSTDTADDDADDQTEEVQDDADDEDDDDEAEFPGAKYGYNGDDPVELAVYEYLVDEIGDEFYDDADACIPVVHIVHVDYTDEKDIKVYGDYWIYNYNIEGDTLKCVSGGDHPGCMHVEKESDDEYEVRERKEDLRRSLRRLRSIPEQSGYEGRRQILCCYGLCQYERDPLHEIPG